MAEIKHKFRSLDRVKYMGNKGFVVMFTADSVVVNFAGPFITGNKTFRVGTKEFKQLKKA